MPFCWLAAGPIWAAAGCGSTTPIPIRGDPVARENYPTIEVEPQLSRWLVQSEPIVERRGTAITKVTVPVRAATEYQDMNIQYEFKFLDANGAPLRVDTGMRFKTLTSRRQEFLQDAPMDSNATDFRLYIRSAR